MGLWQKISKNSYSFPLVFIITHVVSNGVYFWWFNKSLEPENITVEKIGAHNFIWFYGSYWPYWPGLWIIYALIYKKRKFRLAFLYSIVLVLELFCIGRDIVVGILEGVEIDKVDYEVLMSNIYFENGAIERIIYFGLIAASIHCVIIFFHKRFNS